MVQKLKKDKEIQELRAIRHMDPDCLAALSLQPGRTERAVAAKEVSRNRNADFGENLHGEAIRNGAE